MVENNNILRCFSEVLDLSDEIMFIIYKHSKEGDITDRSIESISVNHCDFTNFEIKKSME